MGGMGGMGGMGMNQCPPMCPPMGMMGCDPRMMKKMMKCDMMNKCGPNMMGECPPMGMMGCDPRMMGQYPPMCPPPMCPPMGMMGCDSRMMKKMMKCGMMCPPNWDRMDRRGSSEMRGRGRSMMNMRRFDDSDRTHNRKKHCQVPKIARRAFALADRFGDDPEKYRQFVEETKDKNFVQVMKLWKDNHKQAQDACLKKKAGRLAFLCKESASNMMTIVKENPQMSFRELLKKVCKDKGIHLEGQESDHSEHSDSCPDSDKQEKMRRRRQRKDRRNDDNDEMWRRNHRMQPHFGMPGMWGRWGDREEYREYREDDNSRRNRGSERRDRDYYDHRDEDRSRNQTMRDRREQQRNKQHNSNNSNQTPKGETPNGQSRLGTNESHTNLSTTMSNDTNMNKEGAKTNQAKKNP